MWREEKRGRLGNMKTISIGIAVVFLLVLGFTVVTISLPTGVCGSNTTRTTDFEMGWQTPEDLEDLLGLDGTLFTLFDVISVDATLNIGFWAGLYMPLTVEVTSPEWVTPDCSFDVIFYPEGQSGGEVGFKAHAFAEIVLTAGGFEFPLEVGELLDFTTDFTTPIGVSHCEPMEDRVRLGEIDLSLAGISIVKVAAYFGVEVEITLHGIFVSTIRISSDSLVTQLAYVVPWFDGPSDYTRKMQTTLPAFSNVSVSMQDTVHALYGVTFTLTSVFLEFEALDWAPARLNLTTNFPLISSYSDVPDFETGNDVYDFVYSLYHNNLSIDPFEIPVNTSESNEMFTPYDLFVISWTGPILIIMIVVVVVIKGKEYF